MRYRYLWSWVLLLLFLFTACWKSVQTRQGGGGGGRVPFGVAHNPNLGNGRHGAESVDEFGNEDQDFFDNPGVNPIQLPPIDSLPLNPILPGPVPPTPQPTPSPTPGAGPNPSTPQGEPLTSGLRKCSVCHQNGDSVETKDPTRVAYEVQEGRMPLKSDSRYRAALELTEAEKSALITWASARR